MRSDPTAESGITDFRPRCTIDGMPDVNVPMLVDYLYWMRDRVPCEAADLAPAVFLDTPTLHRRDLRTTLAHEIEDMRGLNYLEEVA